jgi:flagellar protein FliO/FliZ
MRITLNRVAGSIALLLALPVQAADKLFAAPEAANAAATSGSASFGKTTLALAVVLAFVFLAAWVLKQTRKLQQGKGGSAIEIVAQVALGAKERAVLLKVGDAHVLVGVTPGQVNALHVLPPGQLAVIAESDTAATSTETAPSFQSILKRSLGLS